MILRRLELTRFKKYNDYKEFDFEEGINLILANNGMGKSTMIDAIRLLILNLNSSKNLQEMINWNNGNNNFEIACDLSHENKLYRSEMKVEIIGKTVKTERRLLIDDEIIREGASDVVEYLKDIFDPVLTDNALFLRQGANQIVDVTDSERRDVLKKMKDIDYSLKVKKEIEPEIERLKLEIIDLDKEIFSLENKTYDPKIIKDFPFTESKYKEYLKEKESLNSEIILINSKIEEKESKEKDLEDLKELIETNISSVKDNEITISENKVSIKEQDEKKIVEKELIESKIKKLKESIIILELGFDSEGLEINHRAYLETVNNDIAKLEKELELYPTKRISKYDSIPIETKTKEYTTTEIEIKNLKSSIKEMEKGNCPTCGREYEASTISEYKELLEEKEGILNKLEEEKDLLETDRREHEKKVEINITNSEKKVEINNSISSKKEKISSLKSQLDKDIESGKTQIEKELKSEKETLSLHEEKLSNIDVIYDSKITSLENENTRLTLDNEKFSKVNEDLEIKKLKLEKEISDFDIANIEDKKTKLTNITEKVKDFETVETENKTIKNFNDDLTTEEKKDKKDLALKLKSKDKLKSSQLENEQAKTILLKDLPNYIISREIQDLENDINEVIDEVYDRSLNINFKMNKSSITMKYGKNKDNLKNCKGGLSGAESQLTQLAFVSSFNKALGIDCLFLDEVDSAVSESNSEKLYEAIGVMTENYSQVFVITHKQKIKSFIENHYSATTIKL